MRRYVAALVVVSLGACIAAYLYSQEQNIPRHLALALLPAFLLELAFYLTPGFPEVRRRFDRLLLKPTRAALLTASALAPYLLATCLLTGWRAGGFRLSSFLLLAALAGFASFWYVWMKPSGLVDAVFLVCMGAVFWSKCFAIIYPRPMPHLDLEILGRLMWIRLGILALLSLRRIEDVRFGFVPNRSEWRIGIQQFLYFLPAGILAGYLLHVARFHPLPVVWWKFLLVALGTFLGFLWIIGLAEEFFFRGCLQQLIARGLHSETAGLLATSALFGAVHLSFRFFPNWRFALLAGLAGLFYGLAYIRARSVRACMVTHALVVTTWRVLFTA